MGCMKCASVIGLEDRIPDVMRFMMYYNSYGDRDEAIRQFRKLPETVKKNMAHKDFSHAEAICPRHIRIGQAIREALNLLV